MLRSCFRPFCVLARVVINRRRLFNGVNLADNQFLIKKYKLKNFLRCLHEDHIMSGTGDHDDDCIVKLRGLPWSATAEDILKFFSDCSILDGKMGIHMTTSREGRPSGEAFVEFETNEDVDRAVQRDREHMGSRYIEVFKVNKAEMDWVVKRCAPMNGSDEDGCVRLRGLPFGCSKEEIAQFFTGLEIVPNGITLLTDGSGRSSGEAYVQFVNKDVAEKALLRHRDKIGHRYIEIFRSSLSEINGISASSYSSRRLGGSGGMGFSSRPSPYDRGDRFSNQNRFQSRGSRSFKGNFFGGNMPERKFDYDDYDTGSQWGNSGGMNRNGDMGTSRGNYGGNDWDNRGRGGGGGVGGNSSGMHCVHMRGLPYKATEMDIADFFRPVAPLSIRILSDNSGRASGEADVEFGTHDDAIRAMSKDKGHMEHRYIELFLNSANEMGGRGGGGGGGGSGGGSGYGGSSYGSGFGGMARRRF